MFSNKPNPEIFNARYAQALEAIDHGNRSEAILLLSKAIEAQVVRVDAESDPRGREQLQETLGEVVALHKNLVELPEDASPAQLGSLVLSKSKRGTTIHRPEQGGLGVNEFLMLTNRSKFDELVGHFAPKRLLRDMMLVPFRAREFNKNLDLDIRSNFLLVGPRGAGKETLAAAAANSLQGDFYRVDLPNVIRRWSVDPEGSVKTFFERVRARSKDTGRPALLFVDECSTLLAAGEGDAVPDKIYGEFQRQINAIRRLNKEAGGTLFFVGATHAPTAIPRHMLTIFNGNIIYAELPNKHDRSLLLQLNGISKNLADDVDFEVLAERTEGFSAQLLKDLCISVEMQNCLDKYLTGSSKPVAQEKFLQQISRMEPSMTSEEIAALEAWASKNAFTEVDVRK